MRRLRLIVLVVVCLCLLTSQAFAGHVQRTGLTLAISIDKQPVTRVRLNLDNSTTGEHIDVEWDPSKTSALTRLVHVKDLTGWNASGWAEPIVLTAGSTAHFLYVKFSDPHALPTTLTGNFQNGVSDAGAPKDEFHIKIETVATTNTKTAKTLGSFQAAAPALTLAGRSSAVVPDAVAELLQVFAEIAVDKAKTRAFLVVREQVRVAVCEELVWNARLRAALHLRGANAPADGSPLLPRTCNAVKELRLEELASTAKAIATDLVEDLADIAVSELEPAIERALLDALRGELRTIVSDAAASLANDPVLKGALAKLRLAIENGSPMADVLFAAEHLLDVAITGHWTVVDLTTMQADLAKAGSNPDVLVKTLVTMAVRLARAPELLGLDSASPATSKLIARIVELGQIVADPHASRADIGKRLGAVIDALPSSATERFPELVAAMGRLRDSLEGSAGGLGDALKAVLDKAVVAALELNVPTSLCNLFAKNPNDPRVLALENLGRALYTSGGLSIGFFVAHWKDIKTLIDKELPPAFEAASKEIETLGPLVLSIGRTLVEAATGKITPGRAAQMVVLALAKADWSTALCATSTAANRTHACEAACALDIGFELVDACLEDSAGCTPAKLAKLVTEHTEAKGDAGSACAQVEDQLEKAWPGFEATLLKILEILQPSADATPKSTALAAVDLFFDILDRRFCSGGPTAVCADAGDMRIVVKGMIEGEVPRALVAAGSLLTRALEGAVQDASIDKNRKALTKIIAVAGALTSYAATYTTDPKGDPDKLKEAHDARKKAIEGLIDATTQRANRHGDVVVSVGVNPGFNIYGYQHLTSAQPSNSTVKRDQHLVPQLTLPMGVALQVLPDTRKSKVGCGFHFQVNGMDIAQFAALSDDAKVSKPRWDSFLMVGGQIGLIVGTPTDTFVLGADVRWAPTIFGDDTDTTKNTGGAFRVGGFASYYVPFFDFN